MRNSHWPAQRTAEIILAVARLPYDRLEISGVCRVRLVPCGDELVVVSGDAVLVRLVPQERIQRLISEQFKSRSVVAILSRFGREALDSARSVSKLGRGRRGGDFELG